jgi:hypothetical protein
MRLSSITLGEVCSLCIEQDGRKTAAKPVFLVGTDSGQWSVCGGHLAALVRASNGEKPAVPQNHGTATTQPKATNETAPRATSEGIKPPGESATKAPAGVSVTNNVK